MLSTKKFIREIIVNSALFLSLAYILFLLPYIFFINIGDLNINFVYLYLGIVIAYTIFWLIDKKEFFKDEICK